MNALKITQALIDAGHQVDGVSLAASADSQNGRIDFFSEPTAEERSAAYAILDAFFTSDQKASQQASLHVERLKQEARQPLRDAGYDTMDLVLALHKRLDAFMASDQAALDELQPLSDAIDLASDWFDDAVSAIEGIDPTDQDAESKREAVKAVKSNVPVVRLTKIRKRS